ncbi:MAG: radical SAM family heme chaperone HemW, partial [Pyrinomonadaceae bacterium]
TPSLLDASQVGQILDQLTTQFNFEDNPEVTLEMNPGTVDSNKARDFRLLGVNRASFGAQTFDERQLKRLGRTHSSDDVRRTFNILREAGFSNISFDLIAGLPEQTLDGWSINLNEALTLRPEHLSLYLLEVHEGTPLAEQLRRGRWRKPDEELSAEMYRLMIDRVSAAGYEYYEISNFCLSGFASRHNTKYWTGDTVLGFGCSAHSYDGQGKRWANVRDTHKYIELIENQASPVVEVTELDARQRLSESLYLGLRMMKGIDLRGYRARFSLDIESRYADELERFREAGLVELGHHRLKLTRDGALLSNEVFAAFV